MIPEEERTDIDNSEWTFKVAKQDFINVKKLSSIDSEEKILTIKYFTKSNGKTIQRRHKLADNN